MRWAGPDRIHDLPRLRRRGGHAVTRQVGLAQYSRTDPSIYLGPHLRGSLDDARLTSNLARVLQVLLDGLWHTLLELRIVGGSAADSRIRDLRREEFGGFKIEAQRDPHDPRSGVWTYRLVGPVTRRQLGIVLDVAGDEGNNLIEAMP